MNKERKHYTAEEMAAVLRRHLLETDLLDAANISWNITSASLYLRTRR
jgi:hypothetical protein